MTQLTDIDDFRLNTFLHDYETHVAFGEHGITTLHKTMCYVTDWLGAMHNRTVIRFYDENTEPDSAFIFFAKYHQLHEDLSAYLALINFIRKHAKHFEDDSMDELNHILSAYKLYKKYGMVYLSNLLKNDGLDIFAIPFDDFVELEHTLKFPVL